MGLARIMGFVELMRTAVPGFSANGIIPHLEASSRELDSVVKKSNQAIEEEKEFDRLDLGDSK